jgi:L-ascorbate 6-phosphate lactonase
LQSQRPFGIKWRYNPYKDGVLKKGEVISMHLDQIICTKVIEGAVALWDLGREGIVMKGSKGKIIYFDLNLSGECENAETGEPPLCTQEIRHADYIFITHHPLQALDTDTIQSICTNSPQVKFIVPNAYIAPLRDLGLPTSRIIAARAGGTLHLEGLEVYPVAAKQEEWHGLGYVVKIDGITFYHAGKKMIYEGLVDELRHFKIDLAYIPINSGGTFYCELRQARMHYEEAIELAIELHIDMLIPSYHDLGGAPNESPGYFVDYLYQHHPEQKFRILAPGERIYYLKML